MRGTLLFTFGFWICCWLSADGQQLKSGIDPQGFDRSVRVQDDLFMHVNGQWLLHTPIPDDKSNYGSFTMLADEAQANIREIIERTAEKSNRTGTESQQIGDFYKSYMNEELVEQRALGSLKDELAKIDQLASVEDVVRHMGYLQTIGIGAAIGFFVDQDDKDSTRYLAAIMQSGTTLPDRDYYLKDDAKYLQARDALKEYITKLFELSGLANPAEAAVTILDLETKLAAVQWERTELRNAEKRYNKFEVAKLAEFTPRISWRPFFASVDAPDLSEVNVATPSFFQGLEKVLAETPVPIWQQYLRFNILDAYAPVLPRRYVDLHFKLHDQELAGVPQQKPRWKRAVDTVAGAGTGFGALGDAVGKLYVERHFSPVAKARMDQLVGNLLQAYEASINELTWMTPSTKVRALEKLSKITTKIGYTEKWRDYSALTVDPDDLIGNVMSSARSEHHRMMDRLGKPVDRTEWSMTPQTVNAYYNPGLNEIVFPAAILQPPFFDAEADAAANYGGIGAVIGHEISHAFDDQGSKYDGDGNLKNWWTDEDRDSFTRLTGRLVAQYSEYSPLPGKNVNGELTLGENIADLSGMSIAYKAYQIALAGKDAPLIDGWTGEQRFFLGWGQIWRRKYRDPEMVRRLLTDPHSPSAYRANGPLMNLDEFYSAFEIQPGDRLFKAESERIRIW